jgi:hypothetical protein
MVFQVVYGEAHASCGDAGPHNITPAEHAGHPADRAVTVGVAWHHGDDVQAGPVTQGRGNDSGHRARPQVLIFQVNQAPGPRECLPVFMGDAPLPVRRERVAPQPGRVGAQYLNRVGSSPGTVISRRLGQRPVRHRADVVSAVLELADRAGQVDRAAAIPSLPEGVLKVVHGRSLHLGLDIVPRRPRPVAVGRRHHLRVATTTSFW